MKIRGKEDVRFLVMAIITVAYLVFVSVVPYFIPIDPSYTNLSEAKLAPGVDGHVFGTDGLGRDVFYRTLAGGQESVLIALAVVALVLVVGSLLGMIAGYFGGPLDTVISKIVTIFQAFPSFVLAIAIAGILGQGTLNMILAIALVYWTIFARLARGLTISLKNSESVRTAWICGASPGAILSKYILPNVTAELVITAALTVGEVVLTMAGLSFLGLGPARPTNEWGAMMSDSRSLLQMAPWTIIVPGVALFIAVVIFNLFGDLLRDKLDRRGGTRVEVANSTEGIEDERNQSGNSENEADVPGVRHRNPAGHRSHDPRAFGVRVVGQ